MANALIGLVLIGSLAFSLTHPWSAKAAVSDNLNFQARLEGINGAIVADGFYNVEFRLYNAPTGGTALWAETYLNSASQGVRVVNGYLTVNLGSVTAFPTTMAWDQSLYITMNIGGTTAGSPTWDGEMNPRLQLTAVPYAFQAKSASQLQVSNGANVGTLSFAAPTGTRNILLPDASGTVCLDQSINNCNYASSSGSNAYIQNSTSLQGNANFNIQSGGTGNITAVVQALAGQTADLLQFKNAAGTAALSGFNSSGQLYYQSGSFTGTLVQDALAQSTVYHLPDPGAATATICLTTGNCAGTGGGITGSGTTNYVARFNSSSTLNASSQLYDNGSFVGVNTITGSGKLAVVSGNASQVGLYIESAASATAPTLLLKGGATPGAGGNLLDFQDPSGNLLATITANASILTGAKAVVGSVTIPSGTTGQLTVVAGGGANVGAVIRAGASQTGQLLQLQDDSGNVHATFNATGNQLSLGRVAGSGTVSQGKLILADGTTDNFSLTLQSAVLTANSVITVPNAGGNDTVCLLSLANCTGTGGGIAGSGTQHYLAKFDTLGGNHVGDSSIYNNGSFVGIGTTTNNALLSLLGSVTTQPTLVAQAAANATTPVAIIKGGATPASGGDLLQLQLENGTVVARFDAAGQLIVTAGANITGTTTINASGSASTSIGNATGAFSVTSSALNITTAGALSGITTLQASGALTAATSGNTINGLIINGGSLSGITGYNQGSGNFAIGGNGTFNTGSGAVTLGSLGAGLVQSSSSGLLSSGAVDRNNSFFSNALTVTNGGTGVTTLTSNGLLYGNGTGTVQVTAAGTNAQFLLSNNGTPVFRTLSGDASITNMGALTVNNLQGNALTITSPTSGQYLRYNGSAFVNSALQPGDISGTLFTVAGTSGTNQTISSGDTLSILRGNSNNLTTIGSATDTITVDIVQNPTFTGTLTASNSSGVALAISGTPTANAAQSLLQLGNAISGGNATVGTGGTYLGINQPLSGAGSTADFLNFQNNGIMKAQLDTNGSLVLAGNSSILRNSNSGTQFLINNSTNGTNAAAILALGNNLAAASGLSLGSSTFTGAGGANGLNLINGVGGPINLFTGGSSRLSVSSTGTVTINALGAGLVQSSSGGVLSSGVVDRNSATLLSATLNVSNGGTGAGTFTANGVLYGSGTGALGVTGAGTTGQCLVATTGSAPQWSSCAGAGSGVTLQAAYGNGNTILTTDGRDIDFTLANTTTDPHFTVDIATGSTGQFKVQNNGTDVLAIGSTGQLALSVQGSTGGLLLGGDTNLYRLSASTLRTDGSLSVGSVFGAGSFIASNSFVWANASTPADQAFLGVTASGVNGPGISFGASLDTSLYRSNTDELKTDDSLVVGINLNVSGNISTTTGTIQGSIVNSTTGFRVNNAATAGSYLRGDGTNFVSSVLQAGDLTGTIFTVAGTAGTNQTISSGDTLSILRGSSNNLTTTGSTNDTITIDIINNPTFSGGVTLGTAGNANGLLSFNNSTNSNLAIIGGGIPTGGNATFNLPSLATGSYTICTTATCAAGGGSGYIQNLMPSTGTPQSANLFIQSGDSAANPTAAIRLVSGQTGDFLQFQANNGSVLARIDASGNIQGVNLTASGALAGNSLSVNGGALAINSSGAITAATGITSSGTITFSGLSAAGLVQTNSSGQLSTSAVDRNSTSLLSGTLSVSNGGTGATSLASNGILYGNGTGAVQATSSAANSILITNGSSVPLLSQTLPTAVQGNITQTGALSAGSIASGFGPISTGNNISTTATLQGDIVNATTGFRVNNTATAGNYLRGDGTNFISSALQAGDISGTLFTVAGTNGTNQIISSGDTLSILRGASNNLTTTGSATDTITIDIVNNPTFAGLLTASGGLTAAGTVTLSSLGGGLVQSSSGGVLSSGAVDRNSSSFFSNALSVANGGTGVTSLASNGILYGNGTGAVQATGSAADSILITNGSSVPLLSQTLPGAVQANITQTGTLSAGSIASGFGTISTGNNITTTATVQGSIVNATTGFRLNNAATAGHYLRGNGTNFISSALQAGDISGTLFTVAGTSGTNQAISTGDTLSILRGASNNLTTTGGATDTITIDIVQNPTFTGTVTASNSSGVALAVTGTPTASATQSLVRLGNAIAGGNTTAGTGGTYLGINQPSSGAGSTADFFNFQNNGVMRAQLDTSGGLTLAGSILASRNSNSNSFMWVNNSTAGANAASSFILGNDGGFGNGLILGSSGYTAFGGANSLNLINGVSGGSIHLFTGGSSRLSVSSTGAVTINALGAGLVQSSSAGLLSSGAVDRNSSTFFNTALTVANGGTGVTSLTSNGILYGNGTGAIQTTSAAANSVLATNGSNIPSLVQTLPTVVQDNITRTGALTSGSIASGFGTISTSNNITTTATLQGSFVDRSSAGALGIGNSNATSISICNSAACDVLSLGINNDADTIQIGDASDTLSLDSTGLTVTTAGAITARGNSLALGTIGTMASLSLANTGSSVGILQAQPISSGSGNVTYNLPSLTGGSNVDICVSTGNCATAGGGVTTLGGTNNYITKFTGTQTLGNSNIYDDGIGVTIGYTGVAPAALFNVGNNNQFQVNASGSITTSGTYNTNIFTGSNLQFGSASAANLQSASGQQLNINTISGGNVVIGSSTSGTTQITLQNSTPTTTSSVVVGSGGTTVTGTYLNNGTATTVNATNNAAGAGSITVNGLGINLTGHTTSGGQNIINGINLGSVSAIANNTFNGIVFGSGYNSILRQGSATLIDGSGILQNAAISSSTDYTNLRRVGDLISGSISSGFGVISTANNITTTAGLSGGTIQGGSAAQFQINAGGNVNTAAGYVQTGTSANTLSGATTISNSLTLSGASAGNHLRVTGIFSAAAGVSLVQFSNTAIASGTSSSSGTYIGINQPAAGAGSVADFINFQNNGNVRLRVDTDGDITTSGTINVQNNGSVNPAISVSGFVGAQGGFQVGIGGSGTLLNATSLNFTGNGTVSANSGSNSLVLQSSNLNIDSSGVITTTGTLGAAGNTRYLCYNASNQIADCSATATGTAFVQGGNTFSGTTAADFGTNNNGNINFRANNGVRLVMDTTGNLTFQQASSILTQGAANLTIDTGGAATLNLANTNATTVNIGTGSTARAITLGNSQATTTAVFTAGAYNLKVTNTGVGINTATTGAGSPTADLSFGNGANRTVNVVQASSGNGNNLTIQAGQGASTADNGGHLVLQAGARGGASGLAGSVIVRSNGSDNATNPAFMIQNSASTALFTVDTTSANFRVIIGNPTVNITGTSGNLAVAGAVQVNGQLYIGSGVTNFASFDGTTHELTLSGTARHTKIVTLAPEYPGAVLTGDGSNNLGTMTSDFCSSIGSLSINGSICGTSQQHNYYSWTAASAINDYDIWARWQVPSDFSAFNTASNVVTYSGWRTSTSSSYTLTFYNGDQSCGSVAVSGAGTVGSWVTSNIANLTGCGTITAGTTVFNVRVQMSVGAANDFVRAGEININYLSRY